MRYGNFGAAARLVRDTCSGVFSPDNRKKLFLVMRMAVYGTESANVRQVRCLLRYELARRAGRKVMLRACAVSLLKSISALRLSVSWRPYLDRHAGTPWHQPNPETSAEPLAAKREATFRGFALGRLQRVLVPSRREQLVPVSDARRADHGVVLSTSSASLRNTGAVLLLWVGGILAKFRQVERLAAAFLGCCRISVPGIHAAFPHK